MGAVALRAKKAKPEKKETRNKSNRPIKSTAKSDKATLLARKISMLLPKNLKQSAVQ